MIVPYYAKWWSWVMGSLTLASPNLSQHHVVAQLWHKVRIKQYTFLYNVNCFRFTLQSQLLYL